MTAGEALLDTGALIAFLHRDDRHHRACTGAFEGFHGIFLTTEAVLTEAMHLLARVHGGPTACIEFFIRGGALLAPASRESLGRCRDLMETYRNVPMDYADATLVALAEEVGVRQVFTLDRRGFGTYRLRGRGSFEIRPDV